MKRLLTLLSPILVLLAATFCASLLAYGITLIFGDAVSFRTVFKRSSQFFLVSSIIPLMYVLKLSRYDIGFATQPQFLRQLGQGFGIGLITLLPVLAVIFLLGVHVVDEGKPWDMIWIGKKLGLELLLALLIGFVEEPIFRGILLTGLTKQFSPKTAIVVAAFYCAALHFLNSNIQIPSQDAGVFSGFILLGDAFNQLLNQEYLSPFLSLFAVGLFLGLIKTHIPASLGVCIGCHACWVWQIKLSKHFFNINPDSDFSYLVSSYDGVIGPMVTLWLLAASLVYVLYQRLDNPSQG